MFFLDVQKSFLQEENKGVLYLVGTPIGNLDDMTYRAVQILQEVDMIAAEDTRQTIKLLNHFHIQKKLISYYEHNKEERGKELIKQLRNGAKIALVSDAGMPAISDPGYELVVEAVMNQMKVIPIPGANAAISGLVASGLPTNQFIFVGFLPRDKKGLLQELNRLKTYQETLIIYESPHRINKTLHFLYDVLGNRNAVCIRELTKKFEEFIRGSIEELVSYVEEHPLKGELTIVIEGSNEEPKEDEIERWWLEMTIKQQVEYYISHGNTVKEAIKLTSIDRQLSKREVYQAYHGH